MRHLLTTKEFNKEELLELLQLGRAMKANPAGFRTSLAHKSIVTLFEKPSLRTRVTFDIGIHRLGGHAVYLDQQNGAMGNRETVKDFAGNLSRWCEGIVARCLITRRCWSCASMRLCLSSTRCAISTIPARRWLTS